MEYKKVVDVYEALSNTTKGLEKTKILGEFLNDVKKSGEYEIIYLLQGRVSADYDKKELGISQQLAIKAISTASGLKDSEIVRDFKELGDLGKVSEKVMKTKRQSSLFSKKLTTEKILENLHKLVTLEGKGTVDKKIGLIVELLHSASVVESKYIVRTVVGDMKVGVGSGLLRDAIVDSCFSPKDLSEKKEYGEKVQQAYDKATDFAEVFEKACRNQLSRISLSPGKPVKVMLFPKAKDVEDAFRIVGKPAAFEYKYDGFRMMINKFEKNGKEEIQIFTRRLDNVTKQFPDAVKYAKENIKAKSFIIDCEAVGYNPKTKKYQPFQAISQRIKRKYDIDKLEKELPIELNIFDIIYYNGENLIDTEFLERRKIIEKIVDEKKLKIVLSAQIITSDAKEAEDFYEKALEEGQEGLMAKSLTAPYKPGARVGYAVKLKPEDNDFDLVITGAEYGTGKRAGWLTSFDVSCRDEKSDELLEIGKVSTGLKEKREEGLSFEEMTHRLKKIIVEEHGRSVVVRPEIVVTVQYQNIQTSPTYNSGFALRFPRIKALRPDRGKDDVATLKEIEKEAKK
ncbi:MAG: ATP-dependent DNA ligase [archaeon]